MSKIYVDDLKSFLREYGSSIPIVVKVYNENGSSILQEVRSIYYKEEYNKEPVFVLET